MHQFFMRYMFEELIWPKSCQPNSTNTTQQGPYLSVQNELNYIPFGCNKIKEKKERKRGSSEKAKKEN